MRARHALTTLLGGLLLVAGCASSRMTPIEPYRGERISRPDRMIVHDFAASPADIPAWSGIARGFDASTAPQTPHDLAVGRELGAQIAKELVTQIRRWGLPAVRAAGEPAPRTGEIVIVGYFQSVTPGSAGKRVALGFGSGAAELRTVVMGYLMTEQGLRRLASGVVGSGGDKMPGGAAPLALAIATGNPIGLAVSGAAKVQGEVSGRATIEGAAKRTAAEIAEQVRAACRRQGWI